MHAVLAVALGVRIAFLQYLGSGAILETAHHEHATIAKSLAIGKGFCFNFFGRLEQPLPTGQQAPFVPALLAGSYLVFGVETRASLLAVVALQVLAGAATAAALGNAAARFSHSPPIGLTVGLAAACYPPLAIAVLHVQALPWNLLWLATLLDASARLHCNDGQRGAWTCLVLVAVAGILTDPIFASVVTAVLAAQIYRSRRAVRSANARSAAVAVLAIAALLSPWLIRNYLVLGRFAFIKSSFWYVFWQGNNRRSFGTDKLPPEPADSAEVQRAADPKAAWQRAIELRRRSRSVDSTLSTEQLRHLTALSSEMERMDQFRTWIFAELRDKPIHYLAMCGKRLRKWVWFDETNPRSLVWPYVTSYLCLLALAMPALPTVWRRRWDWAPVIAAALALSAVHIAIIVSARFRVPIEMLLLMPAGVTVERSFVAFKKANGPPVVATGGP